MDRFKAVQLEALKAVIDPDSDAYLRHIFRWYSKTFHTPLHLVETLDEDDVLLAFYEEHFEEMSEEERDRQLQELLETPEERRIRLAKLDADRMEAFVFARFSSEQEEKAKKLSEIDPTKMESPLTNPAFKATTKNQAPASALPKITAEAPKLEPDIEMKFISSESFEEALESGFGPSKKS